MPTKHRTICSWLLLLSVLLFSCTEDQKTRFRLNGKWRVVSKIEKGVASTPTGDLYMYYVFEHCKAGHTCPVEVGLAENGQTHIYDTEWYQVGDEGKTIFFSGHPWNIVLLTGKTLEIQNVEDSLEMKLEKFK